MIREPVVAGTFYPSDPELKVFQPKEPDNQPYFNAMHRVSSHLPAYQEQLACNSSLLRFSSVLLAITRLLKAQATNRR